MWADCGTGGRGSQYPGDSCICRWLNVAVCRARREHFHPITLMPCAPNVQQSTNIHVHTYMYTYKHAINTKSKLVQIQIFFAFYTYYQALNLTMVLSLICQKATFSLRRKLKPNTCNFHLRKWSHPSPLPISNHTIHFSSD